MEAVDSDAATALRRAKLRATSLLVLAAAVYVTTRLVSGGSTGVLGFVQAGADAGMVGGLADWFAVTALFRHPLGIPIPHTALVPRKKVELATKLGEFVTEHFLTPQLLADQVRERGLIANTGSWLATPANSDRLATEAAALLSAGIGALDAANMADYVVELVRRDARRRSYAPVAGRLLRRALDGDMQRPLIDVLVSRAHDYLSTHRGQARDLLRTYLDQQGLLVNIFATGRRVERAVESAIATLADIEADPAHPWREQLTGLATSYAVSLEGSPELAARLNSAVLGLLDDPKVVAVFTELVGDAMESVRQSLEGPANADGTDLRDRIAALVRDLGDRAGADTVFQKRIEDGLVRLLDLVVTRYGGELTSLIREQVGRWSDVEVSQRIELAVGRDLQFIRINGTAVGALAGIAIHAVGTAL